MSRHTEEEKPKPTPFHIRMKRYNAAGQFKGWVSGSFETGEKLYDFYTSHCKPERPRRRRVA